MTIKSLYELITYLENKEYKEFWNEVFAWYNDDDPTPKYTTAVSRIYTIIRVTTENIENLPKPLKSFSEKELTTIQIHHIIQELGTLLLLYDTENIAKMYVYMKIGEQKAEKIIEFEYLFLQHIDENLSKTFKVGDLHNE